MPMYKPSPILNCHPVILNCHPERSLSQLHRERRSRRTCAALKTSATLAVLCLGAFVLTAATAQAAPPAKGVAVTVNEAAHRVDITVDGQPFTSYLWHTSQRKPIDRKSVV